MRPQYVYRATNFTFKDGNSKPKYFVVFHQDEDSVLLFSLTTSQSKLPRDLDNEDTDGCVHFDDHRGYAHAFLWKPNDVIGRNGFSFPSRTSIQWEFRTQLYSFKEDAIRAMVKGDIAECCCLTNRVFASILKCILKSDYLSKRQKREIEDRLATL